MEEKGVEFVACDESSEGLEQTDRAFDDPAFTITPQRWGVFGRRSFATATVRTDEFDAAVGQAFAERIAVGGPIVYQPVRQSSYDRLLKQRLDSSHFTGTIAVDVDGERQAAAVDKSMSFEPLPHLVGP